MGSSSSGLSFSPLNFTSLPGRIRPAAWPAGAAAAAAASAAALRCCSALSCGMKSGSSGAGCAWPGG